MTASEIDTIRILLEESKALANDGLIEYEYESIEDSEMPINLKQRDKLLKGYSAKIKDGTNFIDLWSEFRGFLHELARELYPVYSDLPDDFEKPHWDLFWAMVKTSLNAK